MTCPHDTIITWRDEAANPVMWSCMDCGNKFVPLTQQMISDEALLRQALDALYAIIPDVHDWYGEHTHKAHKAIAALKQRLGETK